jgi:hypothetical protein
MTTKVVYITEWQKNNLSKEKRDNNWVAFLEHKGVDRSKLTPAKARELVAEYLGGK